MKTTAELEAENATLREQVRILEHENKNLQTTLNGFRWIHESPARLRALAAQREAELGAAAEETGGGEGL